MQLPQAVLVGVADLLEDGCRRLCGGGLAVPHGEQPQLVVYDVGHGLCVGRRAGSAAPDRVVDLRQLVGYSVCDVCTGCGSRIGT